MNIKDTVKLIAGAVIVGGGIGFLIGRQEVYNMATQCDNLIEANKRIQGEYEDLQRVNDNLREANRWITDVALKEAIVEEYDDMTDAVEAWAEESKQIVDEMSDEEYEETLAYIRSKKHE